MKKAVFLLVMLFVGFSLTSFANDSYQKKSKKGKSSATVNAADFYNVAPEMAGKTVKIIGTVENYGKNKEKVLYLANKGGQKIKVVVGKNGTLFTDGLEGKTLEIIGIVKEKVINEATIDKVKNQKRADKMRKQLKASGKDHLSVYYIMAKSYKVVE